MRSDANAATTAEAFWRVRRKERNDCPGSQSERPSVALDMLAVVPRISVFYGIVIEMYYGDHPPPHFHARYGDEAAKIETATGELIAGSLPRRAARLVREWLEAHRGELEADRGRAVGHEKPQPIEPLR